MRTDIETGGGLGGGVQGERIGAMAVRYAAGEVALWCAGAGVVLDMRRLEAAFSLDGYAWAQACERTMGWQADAELVALLARAAGRIKSDLGAEYVSALQTREPAMLVTSWHLARCPGGGSGHACETLQRFGIESYSPRIRSLRPLPRKMLSRRQRRVDGLTPMRIVTTDMFPGYIFVRISLSSEVWHGAFTMARLHGMAASNGLPTEIGEEMVNHLRSKEVDGSVPGTMPMRAVLAPGEAVRLLDGPFAGFVAEVEKGLDTPIDELDPDTRIRVALLLFGRSTSLDIELSSVERA